MLKWEDYFNEDEKIILNKMAIDDENKMVVESRLKFSEAICEDDIKTLLGDLLEKIKSLSEADWNEIYSLLPFWVSVDDTEGND